MATALRYYALRRQASGAWNQDGTPHYYEEGDEIPAAAFGSERSLRVAIDLDRVVAVPYLVPDAPAPAADAVPDVVPPAAETEPSTETEEPPPKTRGKS